MMAFARGCLLPIHFRSCERKAGADALWTARWLIMTSSPASYGFRWKRSCIAGMVSRLSSPGREPWGGAFHVSSRWQTLRRLIMKWETPAAIDFRFGMEITMYIANR
jgi:pyrroloquinoline quinone biosynthesis protein A